MISFGYEFFQIIRPTKNKNSTNPVIEPTFNTTSFNDLTNIHLLLQQQQNQIITLSKAVTQQQEVKKILFNSSVYLYKK
ncbi:hypothetical protein RirG_270760 [Rhizophagus irregularis DAOM 197198w]|uniref:Uncharacterized protein n=1 Tax=Rhizophagus irregularis (strain DAOM 197198w) TaxID=1432141 RepID=A0A015J6A1_RHIIW|nr:hypothetical protein RirG_270760 [Rhizophagus irregularis DAOM 197198w]